MNFEDYYTAEELRARAAELEAESAAADTDCLCHGTGFLEGEWVFSREPQCTCDANSEDFIFTFHAVDCDTVPCPACSGDGNAAAA